MSKKPNLIKQSITKDRYGPPLGSTSSSQKPSSATQATSSTSQPKTAVQAVKQSQKSITQTPQKTIAPSNRFSILASKPSKASQEPTEYLGKKECLPVGIFAEPSDYKLEAQALAQKYLPPNFHFISTHPTRNQRFYEFILVDTDSIELNHHEDQNGIVQYSQIKIHKVLSPSDWAKPYCQSRSFSKEFTPQTYNYFDYQAAWYNALYLRPYQHSWFIWFNKGISIKFPQWFKLWFHHMGLEEMIFPREVQDYFDYFNSKIKLPLEDRLITFTATQGIAWIVAWDYCALQLYEDTDLYELHRSIRIKWWKSWETKLITQEKIDNWVKSYLLSQKSQKQLGTSSSTPQLAGTSSSTPPAIASKESLFLQEKSRLMAELAAATSEEEFRSRIGSIAGSQGSQHSSDAEADSAPAPAPPQNIEYYPFDFY